MDETPAVAVSAEAAVPAPLAEARAHDVEQSPRR